MENRVPRLVSHSCFSIPAVMYFRWHAWKFPKLKSNFKTCNTSYWAWMLFWWWFVRRVELWQYLFLFLMSVHPSTIRRLYRGCSHHLCKCFHSDMQYPVSKTSASIIRCRNSQRRSGLMGFRLLWHLTVPRPCSPALWPELTALKEKKETGPRGRDFGFAVLSRQNLRRFSCSVLEPETKNNSTNFIKDW